MISLTSATKRAEEFAAAVDGRTAQDSLRPELAELLDVVGAMRAAEAPAPRPDFVASLRERLLEEAQTALTRDAILTLPPRRKSSDRKLAIAASAFVLVGGTAGMAAAAQHALPGDALYPIKRGIEAAQADLSSGDASKGHKLLDQADSRLHEVQSMLADDAASPEVAATLDDFVDQAGEGSQLLLGSFADEQDPAAVEDVRDFTAASMESLGALSALAPADLQGSFADAAGALQQIDEQATAACTVCADKRPALQLASVFSSTGEAQRALDALAGAKTVNNDHPTIGGIPQPGGKGGTGKQDGGDDTTTAGAGSDPSGVTGGDGAGGVLPNLGDTVGGLTGDNETKGGGGVLDDVTDPVKDTVKDVTPDPLDDTLDDLLP